MEFSKKTPKSQHVHLIRHNPYATGGKGYLAKFQNVEKSSFYGTPQRKKPYSSFKKHCTNIKPSRARNILKNTSFQDEKVKEVKSTTLEDGNNLENTKKRSCNSSTEDIYNIFSDDDSDEFLSNKYTKKYENVSDKENNLSTPKLKVNSNKKKTPVIIRSKILRDISPENFKNVSEPDSILKKNVKKTFKFKSFNDKENKNTEKDNFNDDTYAEKTPHLVGFPNFGNTCYLNAVLQTLVSLPSFVTELSYAVEALNTSSSLCQSLWNIIVARQKNDGLKLRNALRIMKENVEKIDGSFSGFKMQDANEFLTQVLDSIKDEMMNESCKGVKEENYNCSTCTPEKLPDLVNLNNNTPDVSSTNISKRSIFSTPSCSPSSPLSEGLKSKENTGLICSLSQNITPEKFVSLINVNNEDDGNEQFIINPVTNNFEFELSESYRCLGCGETEGRRQKHFALYVDLPSEDGKSIQEAVESYMGEDYRELKCENCFHERALVLTSFSELPRVLIVQMKRYKYNVENLELIKVSSKVNINLWLELDKLTTDSVTSPTPFKKPIRYHENRKLTTLSVRNLSSELNVGSTSTPTKNETELHHLKHLKVKESDAEELQEVKKSLEETEESPQILEKSDQEKEEEELQTAIKLSLQDLGMSYINLDVIEDNEIKKHNVEDDSDGKHSYHLISIVSHFGLTTTTGHYVSDVLNCKEGKWYHYDDENVTSIPDSVIGAEGRQKNGYIFFYIHREIYNYMKKLNT